MTKLLANTNDFIGANCAIKNSMMLRKSAAILEAQGNYGHAISLLVLSAEEAIKSIDLYAKASGILEGVGVVYVGEKNKHKARHASIRLIKLVVYHVIELENTVGLNVDAMRDAVVDLIRKMVTNIQNGKLTEEMSKAMNFWKDANVLKNRGFYVDEKSGKWMSPDSLKKEDYLIAYSFVDEIIRISRLVKVIYRYMDRNGSSIFKGKNLLEIIDSIDESELGIGS